MDQGSLSAKCRPGPRACRAKQARRPPSSAAPAGPEGRGGCPDSESSCAAPAGPAGPEESRGCRAASFHAIFFFIPARSDTVGNVTPETATERSILVIASRTRQSQRQQSVLPGKPPPQQLPRLAAPALLSPPPPSQPASNGEVGHIHRCAGTSHAQARECRVMQPSSGGVPPPMEWSNSLLVRPRIARARLRPAVLRSMSQEHLRGLICPAPPGYAAEPSPDATALPLLLVTARP